MRKRENCFTLRLDDEEIQKLDASVAKCGLTRQAYLRHLIRGYVPRAAPTKVFHDMMGALARIGNNLNQIAARANSTGVIEAETYKHDAEELRKLISTLTEAVMSPQPMSEVVTIQTFDRTTKLIAEIEDVIEKYRRDDNANINCKPTTDDTVPEINTLYDDLFGNDADSEEVIY